jgi:DNA (cytosine-5)-methyltransferase 1
MGYHRAGFDVVGVDIDPQPNYPFEFVQGDALQYLAKHGREFDAIHASPPCQGYTALKAVHGNVWPLLIEPTRRMLDQIGVPYVIENVQGAPVRRDLTLCGEMFGLRVIRHRFFELGGWEAVAPAHLPHRGRVAGWRHGKFYDGPYFAVYGNGGGKGTVAQWQDALGIDWTTDRRELAEAIPPAYTEYIGRQLIRALEVAA